MGRCNNRRTQQAAAQLQNRPARARFSNGPPPSSSSSAAKAAKRPTNATSTASTSLPVKGTATPATAPFPNSTTGATSSTKQQQRATNRSSHATETKRNVAHKIAQRVGGASASSHAATGKSSRTTPSRLSTLRQIDIKNLDEITLSEASTRLIFQLLKDLNVVESSQGASQRPTASTHETEVVRAGADHTSEPTVWDDATSAPEALARHLQPSLCRDPVFLHLTTQLSFDAPTAARACQAAQTWLTNDGTVSSSSQGNSALSRVMDWMCLHLSPNELERGFRKASSSSSQAGTGRIKAIPHPSLSVPIPLTNDVAWRRDERTLPFLKLGFVHDEIVRALEQTDPDQTQTCDALDDDLTLRVLLEGLEQQMTRGSSRSIDSVATLAHGTPNDADDTSIDVCQVEDEREAMAAIYEDQFHALSKFRYKICLTSLNDEARVSTPIGDLHVFLRPGYPSQRTPLFLLSNPSLPWPFLRQVNLAMLKCAQEEIGSAVIFAVVSQLLDTFDAQLDNYREEQRANEFKEVCLRETSIQDDINAREVLVNLSVDERKIPDHKQRAKIRGAEKAFEMIKNDESKRILEGERHSHIQTESHSMADRVISQREKDKLEDDLQKASRSAVNAAIDEGKTVEAARVTAKMAEHRTERGLESVLERQNENALQEQWNNSPDSHLVVQPTEATTIAFLDRLRRMCTESSQRKSVGYDLCKPKYVKNDLLQNKLPCPISVPVGDLAQIMKDHVIAIQEDQPWLIAPEARVLAAANDVTATGQCNATNESTGRQKDISQKLKKDLEASWRKPSKQVEAIREQTRELPAYQMKDEIIATVRANQITLISASTGAGKTTVVPSLLLNDMIMRGLGHSANIWVTQPRRISAIGVSERIASERGERVGETCGYSIKLEKKCSKKTRIMLCTTGILLRRLQCDPDLANISHLIIDEVHERDINSDFALIILKELMIRRKSLKLILMSATFDKGIFASYFDSCASVEIPGRAHPVQEFRLEDVLQLTGYEVKEGSNFAIRRKAECNAGRLSKSKLKEMYHPQYDNKTIHSLSIVDESVINYELLAELVEHLSLHGEDGAILVFMPGFSEISKTIDEFSKKDLLKSDKTVIYPLHSLLSTSEQSLVFEVPPIGIRKIVVATNIAETSITISDVLYVVDSGRVKENRRDEIKDTPILVDCWVSKASAQQRRGRAGRVRPGVAYHMFSTHTYESEMHQYQICEMNRVGIEDLVLQVLILDLGEPSTFLARALTPPSAVAMKSSLKLLEELGAVECQWQLNFDESATCANLAETTTELTALGYHLATLPVEPRIGKLIIYGALFGCTDPALTIAAAMSSKNPFLAPFCNRDAADAARRTFSVDDSDHLTMLEAFNQWRTIKTDSGERAASRFAQDNFLGKTTLFQMEELRKQFARLLVDIGFLPTGFILRSAAKSTVPDQSDSNVNSKNINLLKAVLCAGLYPNIILAPRSLVNETSKQDAGEMPFQSRSKGEVYLHPSTLTFTARTLEYRYCCYREIMQTRKLYVRDATVVSPFALLLFGGALNVYHEEGVVTMDEWLEFRIARTPATLVKHLRTQMESMLLRKIVSPEEDILSTPGAKAVIESICTLLQDESNVKQEN